MTFSSLRLSPISALGAFGKRIVEARQVERRALFRVFEQRPAESELVAVVHVGLVGRPAPVQGIEIQPRRPEIDEGVRVVLLHQARRRVERDVVIDELPEIGVAGGNAGVLLVVLDAFLRILEGRRGFLGILLVGLRLGGHRLPKLQQGLSGPVAGRQ
jgi:hypothetical protein